MSGQEDGTLGKVDQGDEKEDLEKITVRVPAEIMDWVRAHKEEYWWPNVSFAFVWAMAQAMMREGYEFRKRGEDEQDYIARLQRETVGWESRVAKRPAQDP